MDLKNINQPHTGKNINAEISNFFRLSGLDISKTLCFVTDRGSNIVAAFKNFDFIVKPNRYISDNSSDSENLNSSDQEVFPFSEDDGVSLDRINCIAHLMNTVLKSSLETNDSQIKLFKYSVLNVISAITKSVKNTEFFNSLSTKKLVKFAATRWNSMYLVLKRLQLIKPSLISACSDLDIIINFSWSDLNSVIDILEPFAQATDLLQSNACPLSHVVTAILGLFDKLRNLKATNEKFKYEIVNLENRLTTYSDSILDPNCSNFCKYYLLACVLDPQKSAELTNDLFEKAIIILKTNLTEKFGQKSTPEIQVLQQNPNQRRTFKVSEQKNNIQNQLDDYIEVLTTGNFNEDCCPFQFWEENKIRFSFFANYALQVLSIPPTSASVERLFSISGNLSSGRRSSTNPNNLKTKTLLAYNRKAI